MVCSVCSQRGLTVILRYAEPHDSGEVRLHVTDVMARIEACIPALRRYASALLRDRQDVDDLVHDCLVRALDRLHTRREDGDLRAWLFAITYNLFISRMRWRKVRGKTESLDMVTDATLEVPATQDAHLEGRDVLKAVDGLPDDQRAVLLLISVDDLSYADVAGILGIPVGTVMSRLSRARERLRNVLSDDRAERPALRRVK